MATFGLGPIVSNLGEADAHRTTPIAMVSAAAILGPGSVPTAGIPSDLVATSTNSRTIGSAGKDMAGDGPTGDDEAGHGRNGMDGGFGHHP